MEIGSTKDAALEIQVGAPSDVPFQSWAWSPGQSAEEAWAQLARTLSHWLNEQGVTVADAVVLLPQIALLNVARQAWARAVGGWPPRFETVGTLLDRLPQPAPDSGAQATLTLDPSVDRLLVSARLRADPAGRDWARRDPDGFDFAVVRMLEVAHQWLKAALALGASDQSDLRERVDTWLGQELTPWGRGDEPDPRAREKVLTAMALAWAQEALPALAWRRTPLFTHRPSAWVAVTPGAQRVEGTESRLMISVLTQALADGIPALWVGAALAPGAGAGAPSLGAPLPCLALAADGEDEARQTAAQVIAWVDEARARGDSRPLALIATDRVVTRRVRALLSPLERQGLLAIADESGWTLSTTRAASAITRMLAAAHPRASTDDVLDWLSSGWVTVPGNPSVLAMLEVHWRQQRRVNPWQAIPASVGQAQPSIQAVLDWAQGVLRPLQDLGRLPLQEALAIVSQALWHTGAWQRLMDDEAGQAVMAALRLPVLDEHGQCTPETNDDALWHQVATATRMGLRDLAHWIDQTLESATYRPSLEADSPDVVITPLTRAVLRPFSAVVIPGADDAQLGVRGSDGWLSPQHVQALGLSSAAQTQQGQWEAFAVLAAMPQVLALSRHLRDGEPVSPSPWLTRWSLAVGRPLAEAAWPEPAQAVPQTSIRFDLTPPEPPRLRPEDDVAQALRPLRVSATAYDALRTCPYRYFALKLLNLGPLEEIEEGLQNRDLGTWLHAVLKRFHDLRLDVGAGASAQDDVAQWLSVADELAAAHGFCSDEQSAFFWPHRATLQRLAAHYIDWLRQHESAGWQVLHSELDCAAPLDCGDGVVVTLHGRLDRVDTARAPSGAGLQLIDYKTGSLPGIKAKVANPLEDTQMGFYAAMAQLDTAVASTTGDRFEMSAQYLSLTDKRCESVPHPDVADTAQALIEGLKADMKRIWQGHEMAILGEGAACDFCEARGLCRRDHRADHGSDPVATGDWA